MRFHLVCRLLLDKTAMDGRLKGAGRYLLVMEKAQHDLSDALSHYQIAGRDRANVFHFFKQKTAYEMESRDWSSDVCSSD
eukprot:COSAG05_NODE_22122_length_267_cov_0.601190_1_plen_79_part_01